MGRGNGVERTRGVGLTLGVGVGGGPATCAISPAGVQRAGVSSTPDHHFTTSPDCRVTQSVAGRIGHAGAYPTVCARIVPPTGIQKK